MKGIVSFHAVDVAFFDTLIAPLAAGGKVNPEEFLQRAAVIRRNGWCARRFALALEQLAAAAEAPQADPGSNLWQRLRSNLERMDHKPDALARAAARVLDPDLHLDGRPFFITEGSAERVADAVDAYAAAPTEEAVDGIAREQLGKMDAALGRDLAPAEIGDLASDLTYRNDLLSLLRKIHELGRAARDGKPWTDGESASRPAPTAIAEELPWRAVALHARAEPFWIARDVDGLETICRAAGVPPPDCLSPAWRLFAESCDAHPALREALGLELRKARDVGAFVSPTEIGALVDFLSAQGARIIGAAARAGEGPMATALMRKIKECAIHAQRHGRGYLEASGILPPERDD